MRVLTASTGTLEPWTVSRKRLPTATSISHRVDDPRRRSVFPGNLREGPAPLRRPPAGQNGDRQMRARLAGISVLQWLGYLSRFFVSIATVSPLP